LVPDLRGSAAVSKTYSELAVLKSRAIASLKPPFVLADHPSHALELVDPPLIGADEACREERLLSVKASLELVDGGRFDRYGHLGLFHLLGFYSHRAHAPPTDPDPTPTTRPHLTNEPRHR
jgi:hypothetical protein